MWNCKVLEKTGSTFCGSFSEVGFMGGQAANGIFTYVKEDF